MRTSSGGALPARILASSPAKQPEIDAGLGAEFVRPEGQRIDRGDDLRTDAGVEREVRRI
jgi:hypothetical protein